MKSLARFNSLLTAALLVALLLLWWLAAQGRLAELADAILTQSGVLAEVMLGLSVMLGSLVGTRALSGLISRSLKTGWHGLLSGSALVLGAVHGAFSLVGGERLTLAGALIPGLARYSTLNIALGTLALYLLAAVYVSWGARRHIGLKLARGLHLLSYPAFVLALLHSIWLRGGLPQSYEVLLMVGAVTALGVRLWTLLAHKWGR